jgi:hypothetical protein
MPAEALRRLKAVVLSAVEAERVRLQASADSRQVCAGTAACQQQAVSPAPQPVHPSPQLALSVSKPASERSQTPRNVFRRLLYLAAACFCLAVLPVLAYLAPRVWKAVFPPTASRPSNETRPSSNPAGTVPPLASDAEGKGAILALSTTSVAPATTRALAGTLPDSPELEKTIGDFVTRTEVEAMLPHTEAEYEAWARREYPHLLWLYDVLTRPEYGIGWDGQPRHLPTWAKRLSADASPQNLPTGWRALLLYSGELLRFDYPARQDEPNVRPRLESVQLAAAVAGFEVRLDRADGIDLPAEWAGWGSEKTVSGQAKIRLVPSDTPPAPELGPLSQEQTLPDGYVAQVVAAPPLARSILSYLHVSSTIAKEAISSTTPEHESLQVLAITCPREVLERLLLCTTTKENMAECPVLSSIYSDVERALQLRREVRNGLIRDRKAGCFVHSLQNREE